MRWLRLLPCTLVLACTANPPAPVPTGSPAPPLTPRAQQPIVPPPSLPKPAPGFGPEILLPKAEAEDTEIARIGDLVLRRSHAYTRLLSAHPKLALSAVDLLVFDVLVAQHAQQFGIRVEPERIEQLAAAEEVQVRDQVKAELGGELDFAGYVWRLFGLRENDWQQTLRLRTAQRLYQGYVIRYLALREDRVQVRFLVHKDQAQADEVVAKVQQGADFGTLALRLSEDDSRRDGGLLPPFARGSQHPVAEVAFTLQKGQVSAPFRGRWRDEERWFVVYCLEHLQGRSRPFAEVRDEIDADLQNRAIGAFERTAYLLRWRGELEQAPAPRVAPDR